MREKRGALGRTVGVVAGGLANAARRSQAASVTRVVVYDSAGQPTLLRPEAPEYAALAGAAEKLIATAREGRPRGRAGAPEGAGEPE
jgi:hypothetical protein